MNEYLISPSWLYWIDVLSVVKTGATIAFALLLASVGIGAVIYCCDCGDIQDLLKKKFTYVLLSAMVVSLLMALFIPSKTTMVEMMIAQYATHENIQYSIETIKEIADYILRAVGK